MHFCNAHHKCMYLLSAHTLASTHHIQCVTCMYMIVLTVCRWCPTWALAWEHRREQIMKEITSFDADIVTLQVLICVLAYIHTYIHTYINTYIHTYINACIHSYLPLKCSCYKVHVTFPILFEMM